MSGNATEEGLLGQIGNPSHADPLRAVSLAAFVAGGLAYLLARWLIPPLTVWGGISLGIGVCLLVAWGLARQSRRRAAARVELELERRRQEQVALAKAQIAAMRPAPQQPTK